MKYLRYGMLGLGLLGVFGFALKGGIDLYQSRASIAVKYPGPLPTGHLAPSEQFLADYANYKNLDKQVRELQADKGLVEKQRLLQGTIDALNAQIPTGYVWDEASMSFKPRPAPGLPPAAPAPEAKK